VGRPLLTERDRHLPVTGFSHLKSNRLQEFDHELAIAGFVFHNQNPVGGLSRFNARHFLIMKGTEAAAATSVGVALTSVPIEPPPFQMIVNRPFICAIRDNQTGTILFIGSVVDPQ
jgi:hypothetical protein